MGKRERELFTYVNGALFWAKPTSNRVKVGSQAGSYTTNGYLTVKYDKKCRMLHRVIWDYHNDTGCEGYLVDHINGNPLDNRIENLRLCDYSHNAANSRRHTDNSVGFKGVHLHKDGRYRATLCSNGVRRHLGLFKTAEDAHAAYIRAAELSFGDFSNRGLS